MSIKVINDVKLSFKDVLIRPKRSEAISREQVGLNREFVTRSDRNIQGCPIIAANMDTTGSFAMAKELAHLDCFTALHKHYTEEEYVEFFKENELYSHKVFFSIGAKESDIVKLYSVQQKLANVGTELRMLCMDVVNGYSMHFSQTIERIREKYPDVGISWFYDEPGCELAGYLPD